MANTDPLESAASLAARTPVRQQGEDAAYRAARTALLTREYELRRLREAVAGERRRLPPGPIVTDRYRFEGAEGETNLAGLFGDHDTLVVYTMMFAGQGDRVRPCPMCTTTVEGWDAHIPSMQRNFAVAIVARRTRHAEMAAFADERHWRHLPLYADRDGTYVSDRGAIGDGDQDVPDLTVFTKADGAIRLFWSDEMAIADPGQDPRGHLDVEPLWNLLDATPAGRRADWYPTLDD